MDKKKKLKIVQVTGRPDSAMAVLENISCNRCWIIDDVWHSILIDKSIFITTRIPPAAYIYLNVRLIKYVYFEIYTYVLLYIIRLTH